MLYTITLDGSETPEQLASVVRSILALANATPAAPIRDARPAESVAAPLAPAATPAAAATSTSVPEVPKDTSTDDRDAEGLTWDGRIHSSSKGRNADGTWRMRKNLEKAGIDVEAVKAELRGAPSVPEVPAPPAPTTTVQTWPTDGLLTYQQLVKLVTDNQVDFTRVSQAILQLGKSAGNLPTLKTLGEKEPQVFGQVAELLGLVAGDDEE